MQSDLSTWQYWWIFNKDPLLQIRRRIRTRDPATGGAEFFLGRGQSDAPTPMEWPTPFDVRERIVPALARALEGSPSIDVVSSALIALARIGDDPQQTGVGLSPMAELIRGRLTSANQEIQETAALALGILANERNVFLLAQLVEGDSRALRELGIDFGGEVPERTRAFAAYALGLIGIQAGVPARAEIVRIVATRLEQEGCEPARLDLAVACISALGLTPLPWRPDATRPLPDAKDIRTKALHSREEQLLWLLDLYERSELADLAAGHLPVAVGRLLSDVPPAHPLRLRALARLSKDLDPLERVDNARRRGAALALGLIADAGESHADAVARNALARAIEEIADRQTRFFALMSLAQAASRPAPGSGNPLEAVHGKENVRNLLLDKLARGRSGLPLWAALGLGLLEHRLQELGWPASPEVRLALLEQLDDAHGAEELGALAIAAGLYGGDDMARALREKLERVSDPEALVNVAVGLGMVGQRSDLETLLELARASRFRPLLMEGASVGAALLGGRQVCAELVAMLEASSGLASQASICTGLGVLGDRRAVEPLLALLEDPRRPDMARAIAAVALGHVADKQDLPWRSVLSVQSNYAADVPTFFEPYGSAGILNLY